MNFNFGVHYTILIVRNPQNSIGNYLGPYTICLGFWVEGAGFRDFWTLSHTLYDPSSAKANSSSLTILLHLSDTSGTLDSWILTPQKVAHRMKDN